MKKIVLILFFAVFFVGLVSAGTLPIYVKPKVNGVLQPNTYFNYTLNFTTDSSCNDVVISHTEKNLLIGSDGIGLINVTIPDSLSAVPSYVCEYRNGIFRAVVPISSQIFNKSYFQNINVSNNAAINQNLSVGNYGFFTYLGSLLNRIIKLFVRDIDVSNNIDVGGNATVEGYIFGQPIKGYLGSGIIWAEEVDENGNLNVSNPSGLTINYPGFVIRLVKTDNTEKYCNISSGSVNVPDETHSVYYVDSNCNIQHAPIQNYIATHLSPGGIADFFNVISHSGNIEVLAGSGLMNKEDIKTRKNTFKLSNLDVISGMGIIQEDFPKISVTSGEYTYINEVFTTSSQNTSAGDTIELIYRQGGNWQYSDQTGLNLTWCDDGTNSAECSNPTKYRRYYIGIIGSNDSVDTTELHQLAASETETYPNLASCLDISANPVSFDLPSNYEYGFVLLYAYCGRANGNNWLDGFIDLRTTSTSVATGLPDLSVFLTRDGTRTLTDNWNVGGYNITNISKIQSSEVEVNDKIILNNSSEITDSSNSISTYFENGYFVVEG